MSPFNPLNPPDTREHERAMAFQVIAHGSPTAHLSQDALEAAAERSLAVLLDRARGVALGPVAGCDFNENRIEVEFTVEADSVEDLHRRLGDILAMLEQDVSFEYQDSTTSRLDEREPVYA